MSDDRLALRLAEAMVFAASAPVAESAVAELLVAQRAIDPDQAVPATRAVLDRLRLDCAGRGVVLVQLGEGWQFRTAPDLAPALTRVLARPRRLPRVAMETLAIIAYHQPCTRTEIETIRGVSLGQQTLDQLLEASLIVPKGVRQVPGRPTLWGTSPAFLQHFGLGALADLPRREELLLELPQTGGSAPADG